VVLLAACEPVSTGSKLAWGSVLAVLALGYLAVVVICVARARGERGRLVACCLAAFAIGVALFLVPGGFEDSFVIRAMFGFAIGAALGAIAFAIRGRRPVAYVVATTLSGGTTTVALILGVFALFTFTDACLS
jgi:hypothetical protein